MSGVFSYQLHLASEDVVFEVCPIDVDSEVSIVPPSETLRNLVLQLVLHVEIRRVDKVLELLEVILQQLLLLLQLPLSLL